jgi:tyrosine-protein phosphatase YwqE
MGIISELKQERQKDETDINNLVKKIYEECLKMIKFKNRNGITDMVYETPYIFPGYPLYDVQIVSVKLNKHLKKQGFKTTYSPPNKIFISWADQ